MKVKFPEHMDCATAIELSIRHWQRMIRWAKKQKPHRHVDQGICGNIYSMYDAIHESSRSNDCGLCDKFSSSNKGCSNCPLWLATDGIGCGMSSWWRITRDSATWGTWVKNAEKMLAILKEL